MKGETNEEESEGGPGSDDEEDKGMGTVVFCILPLSPQFIRVISEGLEVGGLVL